MLCRSLLEVTNCDLKTLTAMDARKRVASGFRLRPLDGFDPLDELGTGMLRAEPREHGAANKAPAFATGFGGPGGWVEGGLGTGVFFTRVQLDHLHVRRFFLGQIDES